MSQKLERVAASTFNVTLVVRRLLNMGSSFSPVDHPDFRALLYILRENLTVIPEQPIAEEFLSKDVELVRQVILGSD